MGNVRMTFTTEDAQAVRSFMKLENKTDALKRKQKRLSSQTQKGSKSAVSGAKKWANRLAGVATGYMGIQKAMDEAQKALRAYNEQRKEAARSREKSYGGFRELGQLAESPEELKRMITATRQTMSEPSGMDRKEAGKLQFMLESTGREDQRELYSNLSTITDSRQMVESVSTLQGALGEDETGTDKAIVEKLLQASKTAKATVGEIASGTTRAAQSGKGVKASDEELLASIAIGSKGEESVKRVSTRVGAVASAAEKSEDLPTEEGLLGVVEAAQKLEEEGKAVNEIFSEKRSREGYRLLRDNLQDVEKLTGKIGQRGKAADDTGGAFGALTRDRINMVRQEFGETIMSEQIKSERSIQNERKRGKEEKRRQNIIDEYDKLQDASGVNFAQRYTRMGVLKTKSTFGGDPESLLQEIAKWDPRAARMISDRLGYDMKGEGGALNAYTGNAPSFKNTGVAPELLLGSDNIKNETSGTKVEGEIRLKDQRSPQGQRKGGGAGVE